MAIAFGATVFFNRPEEFAQISEVVRQFDFVEYVEFRGEHPFFFPEVTPAEEFAYFRKVMQKANLKCTIHTTMYDINLASLNPWIREAGVACYKKYIEAAAYLEAEVLVVHAGILYKEFAEGPMREEFIRRAETALRESLLELADQAERAGVIIGLENSPPKTDYAMVRDSESHLKMLKLIDHPQVQALVDVAHAHLCQLDLQKYLDELQPFTCELHLHNNFGKEDEHLGLHHGGIDYAEILKHPVCEKVPVIMEIKSYGEVVQTLQWLKDMGY